MTTETEVPMVAEIDCSTNTISYRPMTDDEIAAQKANAVAWAEHQAEREANQAATQALKESAQAKLQALGLTSEEISAITN